LNSLEEKIKSVEAVFEKLDVEISKFQSATSLHCKFGCGKCCFKPDIESTVLEFLPFAFHLHQSNQAEEWLTKLQETDSELCLILNPTQAGTGLCSQYTHRGLICRLFGYSARTNKYGKRELVTCQIIKTEQGSAFAETEKKIEQGLDVPVMNEFYMQLASIDFDLSRDFYPINMAIKKAIEAVMHYYAYR
jgi:Fe-S-cluster containining protein